MNFFPEGIHPAISKLVPICTIFYQSAIKRTFVNLQETAPCEVTKCCFSLTRRVTVGLEPRLERQRLTLIFKEPKRQLYYLTHKCPRDTWQLIAFHLPLSMAWAWHGLTKKNISSHIRVKTFLVLPRDHPVTPRACCVNQSGIHRASHFACPLVSARGPPVSAMGHSVPGSWPPSRESQKRPLPGSRAHARSEGPTE